MKRVIVNADDFGLTSGVNRGIIEASTRGIVTNTTVMSNMPAFAEAIEMARQVHHLAVGVHLNLTIGSPLSSLDLVPNLVDSDGHFLSRKKLLWRIVKNIVKPGEIQRECRRQVESVLETGIIPTHLDSHQYIHLRSVISDVVVKLAEEYRLPLRVPVEKFFVRKWWAWWDIGFIKRKYNRRICRKLCKQLQHDNIKFTEQFRSIFGIFPFPSPVTWDSYRSLLESVTTGTCEIMVHPGYVDPELSSYTKYQEEREEELRALTEPQLREYAERLGIEFITYRDI